MMSVVMSMSLLEGASGLCYDTRHMLWVHAIYVVRIGREGNESTIIVNPKLM